MPDWMSHILATLIALTLLKKNKNRDVAIPASIIPDLDHIFMFIVPRTSLPLAFIASGRFLHSIAGIFALYLIYCAFVGKERLKLVFSVMLLHLALDSGIERGVPLFYPLSSTWLSLGILENYTPFIPVRLRAIYVVLFLYTRKNRGNS